MRITCYFWYKKFTTYKNTKVSNKEKQTQKIKTYTNMKYPVIFWSSNKLQEILEVRTTRCNQRFLFAWEVLNSL